MICTKYSVAIYGNKSCIVEFNEIGWHSALNFIAGSKTYYVEPKVLHFRTMVKEGNVKVFFSKTDLPGNARTR